ncbi:MAG: hypothetical protein LBB94_07600 [Clostridiales bacterium]|jgi:hypothetical protein|nr:hypothetical protein [Clostridiales bacterium]
MRRKYLFLLPAAVMIAFCFYFSQLTKEIEHNLLREKHEEKKLVVSMLARQLDAFIQMQTESEPAYDAHMRALKVAIEDLDRTHMTFARLYDADFTPLSDRIDDTSFDPWEYAAFKKTVRETVSGELELYFDPPGEQGRTALVYYQWTPTQAQPENRFLIVTAISKNAIVTRVAHWVNGGTLVLIAITTLLNMAMVLKLYSPRRAAVLPGPGGQPEALRRPQ